MANINALGVKSEMANPDISGCTVNFTDGYLPLDTVILIGVKTSHYHNVVFERKTIISNGAS